MTKSDVQNGIAGFGCQWIVFDAVGTLIYPNPTVAEAYQAIAAKYGSQFGVSEVAERFRTAFRQSEAIGFGDGSATSAFRFSSHAIEVARWRWIVGQVVPDVDDIESCFADLWQHFARPESWSCFTEVESSLAALNQRGYRLAIASNFDSRLHAVCGGHPALKWIERRFVSSETGFRKPALEFYATVISELNCPPDQILMIGDDPEHDVAGPLAVGMHALLIDRPSKSSTSNSISSLDQLNLDTIFKMSETSSEPKCSATNS